MQTGFKCPGKKEYHSFASGFCLSECKDTCLPASALVQIMGKLRVDKHQGPYVSVTSLLGCRRQIALERSIEYAVEPAKNWYSLRGTLLHLILENPDFASIVEDARRFVYALFRRGEASRDDLEPRWIDLEARLMDFAAALPKLNNIPDWEAETEYEMPIGIKCKTCGVYEWGNDLARLANPLCPTCGSVDVTVLYLKGTLDVLRPGRGEMYDYKTIGDKGLGIIKDGAKQDHIMQFNMYRLLAMRGYPVGMSYATYEPVQVNKIIAYYMTMMQVVKTGGYMSENTAWLVKGNVAAQRMLNPKPGSNVVLAETLSERQELITKKGKKKTSQDPNDFELQEYAKFRVTYAIPEVPLLPLDEVESEVYKRAPQLFQFFEDGSLPDMCDPDMREWKCENFCADQIRGKCDAHNLLVGTPRVAPVQKETAVFGEI